MKIDKAGRVSLVVLVDQDQVSDRSDELSTSAISVLPFLGQLGRFDIPVTWAAEDPAHSVVAHHVQKVAAWHEIAIWASASWVRWHALANRAGDELERRRRDAWRAAMPVTSIVLSDLSPTELPWLAGAKNFAVVSGCPLDSWKSSGGVPTGSSRFGEGPWLASHVVRLHSPTMWTSDADALGARFQVSQTAKQGGTTIVLARLSEIAASPCGVVQLLETLQQLEATGKLETISLGDGGPVRRGAKRTGSQHSALRPAA